MRLVLAIMLILVATCQGQREFLTVASNLGLPPFNFIEDGEAVGFDIDFLDAIADQQEFDYELVQAPFADLFVLVDTGEVDLSISSITINDVRRETFDFSRPYFLASFNVLVPENSTITSLQDLTGKSISVLNATTGQAQAQTFSSNVVPFQSSGAAFDAMASGQVDAYLDDSGIAQYFSNQNPGYRIIEIASEQQFYGIMFPKGSALVDQFNPTITDLIQDGTYAEIYQDWFGTAPDVEVLLAAGEFENPYDVFNTEVAM